MACCLLGAEPGLEPMLTLQLDPWEHTPWNLIQNTYMYKYSAFQENAFGNVIWKFYRHFIQASMC